MYREKPTLGLRPRFYAELDRLTEIQLAMYRKLEKFETIDIEWVQEYNELANRSDDLLEKCKKLQEAKWGEE